MELFAAPRVIDQAETIGDDVAAQSRAMSPIDALHAGAAAISQPATGTSNRQLAGAQPIGVPVVPSAARWAANDRLQPPARWAALGQETRRAALGDETRRAALGLHAGRNATIGIESARVARERDARRAAAAITVPPLARTPLAARPWGSLNPFSRRPNDDTRVEVAQLGLDTADLARTRTRRRSALLALVLGPSAAATVAMADLLPHGGADALEAGVLGLFALLFCWVSAGFWTATMGFLSLLRQADPHLISRSLLGPKARHGAIAPEARTAIVMPICNEDVDRVFAGLRATWESLAATGQLERFDFFVLSDSNDPDLCVAELAAWQAMAREVDGFGRLFYRRRERRVKKKSGNIDDFLRRWGANYRYMVVMDADSVMSGACLSTLVRMMEARPDAGIIQTAPRAVGRDTLFARMQQFASRLYGPLFTAGLHYWQLDESHYWGHNAIIRVAPFMKHCMLAPLPGTGSLSGPIMSHDFVEAALMRRAGWGVWIAHDLPGSYEELPPNLLEELGRDRRWCHGNLMNFRLLFARGIRPVHRALFFTGAMAYASGPLWLGFLLATTAMVVLRDGSAADTGLGLPHGSLLLSGLTMLLLLLPKLFAITLALVRDAAGYGGAARLLTSSALEIALSVLLAPVRMVFHARFVLAALFGWKIEWRSPARSDESTPWRTALAKHGLHAVAGLLWLGALAAIDLNAALWTLPVAAALMLAVPTSVWTSRPAVGRKARALGLFLVPEELVVPRELRRTRALAAQAQDDARRHDWVTAIVDPRLHAVVAASAPLRRRESPQRRHDRVEHVARALLDGPAALDAGQRRRLLRDRLALVHLHRLAWSHSRAHDDWHNARADWQRTVAERGLPSLVPPRGTGDERMLAAAREHRAALQRELALAS